MKPFLAVFAVLALGFSSFGATIRIEPRESDELLASPGMGWQTFHCFADEDRNLQGLSSSSAYFRFYWREIEPQDGQIDFAKFDSLLSHARRCGQKLAFRIMCVGSSAAVDVPLWLKEQGCKGFYFESEGRKHWVPDFADPLFQEKHFRLIRALGKRYNGHPDLDLVDIGSVGRWGEWHMSGTKDLATGKSVPMPSKEVIATIIDEWCRAFPRSPKVVLIGSDDGMRRAATNALGWRADCLGDMGGFSKNWSHMNNFYVQQVEKSGAAEAWKKAPVAFESCWDMRKWSGEGWDIRYIFDYALRLHTSYVNNKSAPIPEGTRPEIERFLKRMGYRLVLRSVEHEPAAKPGERLQVSLACANVGVAPPYRDDLLAARLLNAKTKSIVEISTNSIRGWLPGTNSLTLSVPIPADAIPAQYQLALSIVAPDGNPAVRFANIGRDSEGWFPVSTVTIAP